MIKNTLEYIKSKVWIPPLAPNGCWVWTGYKVKGYGSVRYEGKDYKAHRFFWELKYGPIPPGLQIDHRCRNRACVNPDHLRPVTARENSLAPQSESLAKVYADRTRCPRCGGEFFRQKDGNKIRRRCRKCMNVLHAWAVKKRWGDDPEAHEAYKRHKREYARRRWSESDELKEKQRTKRAAAKAARSVAS